MTLQRKEHQHWHEYMKIWTHWTRSKDVNVTDKQDTFGQKWTTSQGAIQNLQMIDEHDMDDNFTNDRNKSNLRFGT